VTPPADPGDAPTPPRFIPTPPPPPLTPLPPRGGRAAVAGGGVAAAVVLLVLVGLAFAGALPGLSAPAPPSSVAYSDARTLATDAIANVAGGPWSLTLAGGIASTSAETLNLTSAAAATGCTVDLAPGGNGSLSLPPLDASAPDGTAPAWVFAFDGSGGTVAVVTVLDGRAERLATISGTACTSALGLVSPIPSDVVDSTAAMEAADAAGGSAFQASYQSVSEFMGITGGISLPGFAVPASWTIELLACGGTGGGGGVVPIPGAVLSGALFNATVDAESGAVLAESSTPVPCGVGGGYVQPGGPPPVALPSPPSSSLGLVANGTGTVEGANLYRFSVSTSGVAPAPADLSVAVFGSSGPVALPADTTLTVQDATGCSLALWQASTGTWSGATGLNACANASDGAVMPLVSGESLTLVSSASLDGDLLELGATAAGGVAAIVPIP